MQMLLSLHHCLFINEPYVYSKAIPLDLLAHVQAAAEAQIEKYKQFDPKFEESHECKLLENLLKVCWPIVKACVDVCSILSIGACVVVTKRSDARSDAGIQKRG
jgi:hypothetical protein